MEDPELTKVYVDLPNHWGTGGESMWAAALGNDLYEIRNVPFYAYGLNFGDVVLAKASSPNLKPEVRSVVRRSGHRTLRVSFDSKLDPEAGVSLLEALGPLGASFEGMDSKYFAIDILPEPEGHYDQVCNALAKSEDDGLLQYETCEARVSGSFDDRPSEPEDEEAR